ncbi:MAG: S8 family peptidase, partial [Acidobacteriia bacterium]|nr:S8 family peptidase [Terriglobia bacterium]
CNGEVKMKRVLLLALLLLASAAVFSSRHAYGQSGRPEFVPNEVLVKFKPAQRALAIAEQLPRLNAVLRSQIPRLGVDVFKSQSLTTDQLIARLREHPAVEYVEPNYYAYADFTPNDPFFSQQWGMTKIRCPQAWDYTQGNNTLVAVVDSGVQADHPDLQGRLLAGASFVPGFSTPVDDCGHGTHVTGIAAAATNNSTGVAGVGFNTMILPVKVLSYNPPWCSGSFDQVANGITYAADQGAKIINMSLGSYTDSQTVHNAVHYSYDHGALNIAAAGNENLTTMLYPAGYTDVVQPVGARTQSDTKASFSNYGSWVDLYAPGVSIYSTYINSGYFALDGTSMATPHASGVASLIYAKFQSQSPTNSKVRSQIVCAAKKANVTIYQGKRLDALNAVKYTNTLCQTECGNAMNACTANCYQLYCSKGLYQQCQQCNAACRSSLAACQATCCFGF